MSAVGKNAKSIIMKYDSTLNKYIKEEYTGCIVMPEDGYAQYNTFILSRNGDKVTYNGREFTVPTGKVVHVTESGNLMVENKVIYTYPS